MKKGKFIVIDGADGSGKATQTALLVKNLRKAGYEVRVEDFPQYGKKSAALVEEYLNGVYGSAQELGPYIPSIFYAVDRFAASQRIRDNLKRGYIVVTNRYVTANMGHQGSKIRDSKKRQQFYDWLFGLEYGFFKIPRPDLTIILHLPACVAQKLANQKKKRSYLKGKKRDIHENDLGHLQKAEKTYLEMAKVFGYNLVECYKQNKILKREETAKLIWEDAKKIL
jgi:dTMP kinase